MRELIEVKLRDKVAIITGGTAGIGESTALLFVREGVKVVVVGTSIDKGNKVLDKIKKMNGQAIFVKADVSKEEDVKQLIDETIKVFGRIDILFNNAGVVVNGSVETCTMEDFERTIAINIKGVFLCSRFAMPYLKKTHGVIINNSSSVALKGVANRAAYTISKGAVLSLTRAMATDHLEDKVRVNCIAPGTTDTPSLADRLNQSADPVKARQEFIARQKIGRLGTPEEIAEGVLFLACNEFCTGTILSVDGGMTM
jgi:NAD(P)-dependent dehydrogenase (short-subunit alcohol dehydrogenase family)